MSGITKYAVSCSICGKAHPISKMVSFYGKLLCPRCLNVETFTCACCGNYVARSEIATYDGDDIEICQACFDEHFTRCESCGLLLRQSDAHWHFRDGYERPYCDFCFREARGGDQNENTDHF